MSATTDHRLVMVQRGHDLMAAWIVDAHDSPMTPRAVIVEFDRSGNRVLMMDDELTLLVDPPAPVPVQEQETRP